MRVNMYYYVKDFFQDIWKTFKDDFFSTYIDKWGNVLESPETRVDSYVNKVMLCTVVKNQKKCAIIEKLVFFLPPKGLI